MTFSPNPCTKCRCDFDKTFGDHRYGNAVCSVTDCPTLKCTSGQSETEQCCPVCKTPTACPSLDTVEIKLTESEKCKSHKLEPWSSKPILVCWKDQVQTATFILKGTSLKCEIKVKVVDNISPKITCGPDQTLWTNGEDSRVTLANPTATDNVDISPKITKTGGTTFPIGKTTVVNYTAMDKAGNTATCSVKVTVKKQDAAVQECKVPNPTHASLKCTQDGSKMSCRLECESYYVPGPGSGGSSTFECTAGTWTPAFHDTFTNLACVLKQPQVVTVSVTLQLTVDADQVVFLKASLEDYINHNIISGSTYWNRIKQIIVIKGQDRRTRRTKRATRDMDVKMELYITLKDGDDKEDMKSELGRLSGDLNDKLRGDIESNKVKLVADGDNSAVKVRHVQSTQAALGCLPGEQQINDYCVVCPVGTFYKSDQKKCVLCRKDTFQELEGQTQCRSCPANTRAESGSYVQAQCIAEPTKAPKTSSLPLTVIIGAAIGALVLIIIVVIIIVVCKRRNSSQDDEAAQTRGGREAHTNEAYYMQPVKSDEDINEYDDIPADHAPEPPKNENQYMGLGGSQKEPNVYDTVQT
ncbi:Sushi, von Willebrand factor type A, EGF and pentraxin domain-containing protein 1 [Lamellibrachia satsuma]|nr:Sushi, von Willebrand factor type A, EGF and pentraxin domain-containing protein 1 [Lamellibrachia satsuma]